MQTRPQLRIVRNQPSEVCCVYVIEARRPRDGQIGDLIKIGISSDPDGRLASLQTGNPHPLRLEGVVWLGSREEAAQIEAALHARFAEHRRTGEWFLFDPYSALHVAYRLAIKQWFERRMTLSDVLEKLTEQDLCTHLIIELLMDDGWLVERYRP